MAEIEAIHLQTKEHQGLLALSQSWEEARKDSPQNFRANMALLKLRFQLASRNVIK